MAERDQRPGGLLGRVQGPLVPSTDGSASGTAAALPPLPPPAVRIAWMPRWADEARQMVRARGILGRAGGGGAIGIAGIVGIVGIGSIGRSHNCRPTVLTVCLFVCLFSSQF